MADVGGLPPFDPSVLLPLEPPLAEGESHVITFDTVIGPAVNIASRLETLTKETGRNVLFSEEFVRTAGYQGKLENLGPWLLRGLETPVEVYALPHNTALTASAD